MSQLGTYLLLFGLRAGRLRPAVVAAVGARTGRPALVEAARRVAFGLFAIVAAANVTMLVALLTNDFSLRYVAENSARETPVFFKALSLWAADDGSLLLWNLILAGYLAAVAIRFRRHRPPTFPYALGRAVRRAGVLPGAGRRPGPAVRHARAVRRPTGAGRRRCCRTTR